MMNEKTQAHTKSDFIAEDILKKITEGIWKPGTKLPPERELIELYGVSRVSIRKALAILSGRGILTAVQGGGTYVNTTIPTDYLDNALNMMVLDELDYLDIQEFRLLTEPVIAARATSVATPEDLARLKDCLDRYDVAKNSGDKDAALNEDIRFHTLLAECLHNSMMSKVTTLAMDLTIKAIMTTGRSNHKDDGISDLHNIFDCILRNDPNGASSCMWYHISKDFEEYKKEHDMKDKIREDVFSKRWK